MTTERRTFADADHIVVFGFNHATCQRLINEHGLDRRKVIEVNEASGDVEYRLCGFRFTPSTVFVPAECEAYLRLRFPLRFLLRPVGTP